METPQEVADLFKKHEITGVGRAGSGFWSLYLDPEWVREMLDKHPERLKKSLTGFMWDVNEFSVTVTALVLKPEDHPKMNKPLLHVPSLLGMLDQMPPAVVLQMLPTYLPDYAS